MQTVDFAAGRSFGEAHATSHGVLDRLSVFDNDIALQRRVEDLFAQTLVEGSFRPPGPPRAELVRTATEHMPERVSAQINKLDPLAT